MNAATTTMQVHLGDALTVLRTLPDESVHCVSTSPPYWGLRDYGTATWEGGDSACEHERRHWNGPKQTAGASAASGHAARSDRLDRDACASCGATRIDAQLGLEATPEEYVAAMVEVFREVRRVLRKDGTLWLNLGDSYAGSWGNQGRKEERGSQRPINGPMLTPVHDGRYPSSASNTGAVPPGLKPKDLVGIPWSVAFALRADGWYLRSDIVWSKPNPMPESVTDRPTKSHEYLFLLTREPRYYFDADAVREASEPSQREHNLRYARNYATYDSRAGATGQPGNVNNVGIHARPGAAGRNMRSVWTINPQAYAAAHFATFPEAIPLRCIRAGTSAHGCCAECGAPWERVVERTAMVIDRSDRSALGEYGRTQSGTMLEPATSRTTGWAATCDHGAAVVPCTVLDPFAGSGTTLAVAKREGRRAIGIELNPDYIRLLERRLAREQDPLPGIVE